MRVKSGVDASSFGIENSWKPVFLLTTVRKAGLCPSPKKSVEGI